MEGDRILLTVAVVAVVVSVVAAGFTYFSIANFAARISGNAVGTTNLTVEAAAVINFTTDTINWGSGLVDQGQSAAYLDTLSNSSVNGNWTNVGVPLILENIGNVNVSLNLSGAKTAAQFLGGTNPAYQWYVNSSETNSCLNATGTGITNMPHPMATFANVNTTTSLWCGVFRFTDSADTVLIHFNLTVPSDSFTGALGDVITATAFV